MAIAIVLSFYAWLEGASDTCASPPCISGRAWVTDQVPLGLALAAALCSLAGARAGARVCFIGGVVALWLALVPSQLGGLGGIELVLLGLATWVAWAAIRRAWQR